MLIWSTLQVILTGLQVTIRLEEPFYCQELYAILDGVIQTVITDPQADPQLLLDQAVDQFQREYLDKLGR